MKKTILFFVSFLLLSCNKNQSSSSSSDSVAVADSAVIEETEVSQSYSFDNAEKKEAYVFVENLNAYASSSTSSNVVEKISKDRLALVYGNRGFFCIPDATESFVSSNANWFKYFRPAQDEVEPLFFSKKEFDSATKKVDVYTSAPNNWESEKVYEGVGANNYSVKIMSIKIQESGLTINSQKINADFIYEVSIKYLSEVNSYTYYVCNGEELMANNWRSLKYKNGNFYIVDSESGKFTDKTKSFLTVDIPTIEFLGWLSDKEVVINDFVYTVK